MCRRTPAGFTGRARLEGAANRATRTAGSAPPAAPFPEKSWVGEKWLDQRSLKPRIVYNEMG